MMHIPHDADEKEEIQETQTKRYDTPAEWRPAADTIKAIQAEIPGPETPRPDDSQSDTNSGHLVPATTVERLNTLIDEKKASEVAETEYPRKSINELPDANLRGVTYEGIVRRDLEDTHGVDHVATHPEGLTLKDGRPIEPDFAIKDDEGKITELHDAKGYTRKSTQNPEATASTLTHMSDLQRASRYVDVDRPDVERVILDMPQETATMEAVQKQIAELGHVDRPVSIESVGSEADIKQRMDDLRRSPGERFALSADIRSEIERIQALPPKERRDAVGGLVGSLQDSKADETAEARNLRWSARVERDGKGVTIIDDATGDEYSIWYS